MKVRKKKEATTERERRMLAINSDSNSHQVCNAGYMT